MPSDCQCSSACDCTVVKEKVKVLNNKQATKKLQNLEKEVERLTELNEELSRKLRQRTSTTKRKLIETLRDSLDKL